MASTGSFMRSFFGWLFTIPFVLAMGLLNLIMALANYLSLCLTFEMVGLDTVPLGDDKLLGPFFVGLAADASLVNLIAAGLACVVTAGFFVLVRLLLSKWEHWKQLRLHQQEGNRAEVTARRWLIGDTLLWLVLLVPCVVAFSVWDLEMFRYRAVLGAAQVVDTADAVSVPAWSKVQAEAHDVYAIALAKVGMWGYLAVNLMACLLLEFSLLKARKRVHEMTTIVGSWFDSGEQEPGAADSLQSDEDHFEAPARYGSDEPLVVEPLAETPRAFQGPTINPDAPIETIPETVVRQPEAMPADQPRGDHKVVLGGRTDERVTLEDALQNPQRYFVDIRSGLIWDREHWESLHGATGEKEHSDATA